MSDTFGDPRGTFAELPLHYQTAAQREECEAAVRERDALREEVAQLRADLSRGNRATQSIVASVAAIVHSDAVERDAAIRRAHVAEEALAALVRERGEARELGKTIDRENRAERDFMQAQQDELHARAARLAPLEEAARDLAMWHARAIALDGTPDGHAAELETASAWHRLHKAALVVGAGAQTEVPVG